MSTKSYGSTGKHYQLFRDTLIDVILEHVSPKYPRSSRQIIDLVIADYGTITERTLYRYLAKLLEVGKLRVHHTLPSSGHSGEPQRFYVRTA